MICNHVICIFSYFVGNNRHYRFLMSIKYSMFAFSICISFKYSFPIILWLSEMTSFFMLHVSKSSSRIIISCFRFWLIIMNFIATLHQIWIFFQILLWLIWRFSKVLIVLEEGVNIPIFSNFLISSLRSGSIEVLFNFIVFYSIYLTN